MNPLKVIRLKCLDCSADQPSEVEKCPVTKCPLWRYRMGKNPDRKPRALSPDQRRAMGDRLKQARLAKIP